MRNYIIRIYRHGDQHDEGLVGTVELVGGGEKWNFKSRDELWGILRRPKQPGRRRRGPGTITKGDS